MKYSILCLLLVTASAWGLNKKETELFEAVQKQDLAKVKKLLVENKSPLNKEKININARDTEGYTAFLRAIQPDTDHAGVEVLKELIKAGANVNEASEEGPYRFSQNAAINRVLIMLPRFAKDIIRVLLDAGADVSKDKKIVPQVIGSKPELVGMIIQAGAPVNVAIGSNLTPLMYAAMAGYPSIVKLIIERRADLNVQDSQGQTALMLAYDAEVVDVLVKAGARTDIKDNVGKTAADYHKEYGVLTRRSRESEEKEYRKEEKNRGKEDYRTMGLAHAL